VPEGHTLHRLALDQQELVGARVHAASPQGRFPAADLARLDGARVAGIEAWGKHLLQHVDGAGAVHTHLGMRGITLRSSPPVDPKPQVRLRLASDDVAWDLIAPMRCELLEDDEVAALLAGLGPDPLRPDADVARVRAALAVDDRPVGVVLLDQSVVAGVGNVFRAEALHAVGVHPDRPASALDDATFARLWQELVAMMGRAVDEGRIVTRPPDGRAVYKQDRCADCGAPVAAYDLQGRTAYACPACQAA
jgi:formamidopyrimidine-DNA glycosylase